MIDRDNADSLGVSSLDDLLDGARLDTLIDAIKARTDELADGARLDTLIDEIKARTDELADGARLDALIDAIKAGVDQTIKSGESRTLTRSGRDDISFTETRD